ncbi:MAG: V-type ATP synthase subunit D [Euryarchaeota archaeon]|nr:V-type ATP synthase subunit D [Euryarchaeota archaeon]MDE1836764.1 V-type ATP synthase subunit D [Euryarchaeota archaeon]MDE1879782.1 V-type ATP synthase subunit D [Euryarchaeota archaeon]MDE2044748.1 V-type ATP synthase subunit D [Thermoplasmata archaeon]
MPGETIRPTRIELIRTKRRIVLARKGLKLLKLKRAALILEFRTIAKQAFELRGDLRRRFEEGYDAIRKAEMFEGPIRLENISMMLPTLAAMKIASRNVMGVKTPSLQGEVYSPKEAQALLHLPASVDESLRRYQEIYKVVLAVAEKENAMRRLLQEIDKTKRRANAIENVVLPRLNNTVRYIKFRFDEMERDSFAMLKSVKRKMEREAKEIAETPAEERSAGEIRSRPRREVADVAA